MESTLCVDDELKEDEYDALNDETFGGAEADDAWEENHNVLAAQLEETIKREHNAQHIEDIVNTSILQLGLDDEAATNGHSLTSGQTAASASTASSVLGIGSRTDPLGRNNVQQGINNACRATTGFNGFFNRSTTESAVVGSQITAHPASTLAQSPIVLPRPGPAVGQPPTTMVGTPFPSMIGCSAVSAGQLEQQMLQASRAPQNNQRRMKTLEELEKQMVQESRRALLTRPQQQQQPQQPQQQQQQPQQQQEQQQPMLLHQDQQRGARPPFRILRPQLPQQQHSPPSFPQAPPQMLPPPLGHPHGMGPGMSLMRGHGQPHYPVSQPNHIDQADPDHKRPLQQQQPHHQIPQPPRQPSPHLEQHRHYRPHDQYAFHDPSIPRPPPWEMNHNVHHNNWSPQPVYPPPSHFQRPPFHQTAGAPPTKFMGFREPYRGNGTRRHEDVRLPEWANSGPMNNQRRYNTRDVETFGFDAVHEHQQEQNAAAIKATKSPRSDDPYAGLMTDKEKEFVIRVQMMSLNMQAPHEQDYYYLEYMKRRSQGKAVCRNKLLTQRYERTPDRPHEPQQFENSLGKLHTVTAHAPKKILDMAGSRKLDDGDGRTVPANTDLLLFRKLLMDTEKSFSLLLKLEDPEVLTSHEEKLVAAEDLVKRLGPSPDNVLSLRKGRMLVLRSLAALWRLGGHREQCLQMLCSIVENLELILFKQKPLGDAVFVEKFDIIEDILRECVPDEIARLQKCMSKYSTPGDDVGEWVMREKFGSMLSEKLAERCLVT